MYQDTYCWALVLWFGVGFKAEEADTVDTNHSVFSYEGYLGESDHQV